MYIEESKKGREEKRKRKKYSCMFQQANYLNYMLVKFCVSRSRNIRSEHRNFNQTSWNRLISAQIPFIYFYTLFLTYWQGNGKINVLKKKKIDNFVSNCSKYMVQPFVLEVLMSSFERYSS